MVFPFSFLQKFNISVQSILACDPSYTIQFICLCVAAIVIEIFIYLLERCIAALFHKLNRVKTNLLSERIDMLKNDDLSKLVVPRFNKWCNEKGELISTANTNKPRTFKSIFQWKDDDKQSRSEVVDAYMNNPPQKELWTKFAVDEEATELTMCMQHMVSGIFAILALNASHDPESFLIFARWSVLFEAGWEVSDSAKHIFDMISTGRIEFHNILYLSHHVVLYMSLPLNRILLPSRMGPDIEVLFVLCVGLVGPVAIIKFLKNNVNTSVPRGRITFCLLQLLSSITMIITRGPCWFYFAYRILRTLWKDESTTLFLFICSGLTCFLFSAFNVFVIFFCWKGIKNAINKMKMTEDDTNLRIKPDFRKSSLIDVLAQEANMSSRMSINRSMSLMGVDYLLDKDEVMTLNKRASQRTLSVNNSLQTSFLFSHANVKED